MTTDVITLRKLTERSTLGFGKFEHATVEELLNIRQHNYLVWVYYHYAGITFTDEILDKLKIQYSMRIDKPGTSPDTFIKYQKRKQDIFVCAGQTTAERAKRKNILKRKNKHRQFLQTISEKDRFRSGEWSKAQMAWNNQGHTGSVYKS